MCIKTLSVRLKQTTQLHIDQNDDMNSAIPLTDYLNGRTSHTFSYPHFNNEIQQQKIARNHLILYVYFIEPNFLSALKQMLSSTAKKTTWMCNHGVQCH